MRRAETICGGRTEDKTALRLQWLWRRFRSSPIPPQTRSRYGTRQAPPGPPQVRCLSRSSPVCQAPTGPGSPRDASLCEAANCTSSAPRQLKPRRGGARNALTAKSCGVVLHPSRSRDAEPAPPAPSAPLLTSRARNRARRVRSREALRAKRLGGITDMRAGQDGRPSPSAQAREPGAFPSKQPQPAAAARGRRVMR